MINSVARYIAVFLLIVSFVSCSTMQANDEMSSEPMQKEMIMMTSPELVWGDVPPVLPPGAKITVMEGDPFAEGTYGLRLKMPANYQIPAHWHSKIERLTIISGALNAGMGDKLDMEMSKEFPAGSFIVIPAKMNHFAWTKVETVVQINGEGPFDITYIDPADDPRNAN